MANWKEAKLHELSKESLDLLLDHKIPGIILKNFVSKEDCERLAERLRAIQFDNYDHLADIPVHHMGVCHNQWAKEAKNVYFDKVPGARLATERIFEGIIDNPMDRFIRTLHEKTGRQVQVFEEEDYGPYFAGAFRSFRGHGKLHADHAPSHIKTDWAVTKIVKQLTWNIYYSVLNSGGELIIHDTVHTSANDVMKVPGDYYFPYDVLESERHIKIHPEVGDLILFNTQNFHEVMGNKDGSRISQTSFIGVKPDHSLNLWS